MARKASPHHPVDITYTTMMYGPSKKIRLHTYAEVVAWLMLMTDQGRPPLMILSVKQI